MCSGSRRSFRLCYRTLTHSLWAPCIMLNALPKSELVNIDYHDLYNSTIEYTTGTHTKNGTDLTMLPNLLIYK